MDGFGEPSCDFEAVLVERVGDGIFFGKFAERFLVII